MKNWEMKKVVNFVAFIAVVLIALALTLQLIFAKVGLEAGIIGIMQKLGYALACIVALIASLSYVRTKRSVAISIIYAICATAIIALLILV